MNTEIKGLIPWGIFTISITLLHLSCRELLGNHSPVLDELWIFKMHDRIIKLQKQEKENKALGWKPSSRAVYGGNLNLLEGTQRYQRIGGIDMWWPWNIQWT